MDKVTFLKELNELRKKAVKLVDEYYKDKEHASTFVDDNGVVQSTTYHIGLTVFSKDKNGITTNWLRATDPGLWDEGLMDEDLFNKIFRGEE